MTEKLRELLPFKPTMFEQDAKNLRPGVLSKIGGVFQRAEVKNANQRVYPKKLWQEILTNPDVKQRVEARRMVGMLGHPSSGQTDPEKISHVITKQELRNDNTVYGEAEILDTPMGRIADSLLRAGVGIGISSRGDGSVEKKGDYSEVKNDYALETYDLVLKPSTPGAYPEMIAEHTIEENEKLIAEAIDGLVKSEETPKDQRIPLLTECLKILNVLEAKNSGNLVTTLSSRIVEELKETAPEVIVSIEANEEVDPEFNTQQPCTFTEDIMSLNRGGAPAMTGDTLAWHQKQVEAAVRAAVGPYVQENQNLKNTLVQSQREAHTTRQKLAAAESLIEDFTDEVKRLKESGPSDKKLQRRYEAAVELLDEALQRLPEVGTLGRRCKTLEGLVQAGFDHISEERLNRSVKEHLSQINPSFHGTVKPVLESCRTPEQVAKTFKALVAVSGVTEQTRKLDPLPEAGNKPKHGAPKQKVEESHTSEKPKSNWGSLVASRLNKAV